METANKPLILIVDDNLQNIQLLSNILYEKGYNISASSSGTYALQSVKTKAPDLILLDIQMPGLNGFEVCKTLKSDPKTKDIPVIFVTAAIEVENVIQGFGLGAIDYITKPFQIPELLARVATHIELKLSKEKLTELNATKDKFFSIIAHDLKNPFAELLSSCELLKRSVANKDMSKIEKHTDNIYNSTKYTYTLLENLLNWSRLQMDKFEVQKEKFNIHSLIIDALESIQNTAAEKEVEIIITGDEKAEAFFDIEIFKTIIRNFVTNAIKFSNKKEKVFVEITNSNKKYFKISVIDNGVGISEEDLSKLFRIDISHITQGTDNEKGTGLGLILCKNFAEKIGSKIFIDSEEGKGSTFSFIVEKFIAPE